MTPPNLTAARFGMTMPKEITAQESGKILDQCKQCAPNLIGYLDTRRAETVVGTVILWRKQSVLLRLDCMKAVPQLCCLNTKVNLLIGLKASSTADRWGIVTCIYRQAHLFDIATKQDNWAHVDRYIYAPHDRQALNQEFFHPGCKQETKCEMMLSRCAHEQDACIPSIGWQ